MIPRQRPGSLISRRRVRAQAYWCAILALVAVSYGCDMGTTAATPRQPAVTVTHGLLDLDSNDSSITPRARAVTAMNALAKSQGLPFYELPGPNGPIAAMLAIDLRRFEPLLLTKKPTGGSTTTAGIKPKTAIARQGMAVVIGSSFVSQVRTMSPLGLLHYEGETLQPIEAHGYTRILAIASNNRSDSADGTPSAARQAPDRFVVRHRSDWQPDLYRSALQAGPGIIEEGALDISERDLQRSKYFRSFVAECGDTSVVGTSLVPVHLYTLGQSLLAFFAQHSLACSEVVNLAGDRESVLLVRHGNQAAYLGDPAPLKVGLIGFRAR